MATQVSLYGGYQGPSSDPKVNLYLAIKDNNVDVVKILMKGAYQHTSTVCGLGSALHLAADPWRNCSVIVDKSRLQRLTAQIAQLLSQQQPDPASVEPITPHPTLQANLKIIQVLLAKLPDPNPVDSVTNMTPLHVSVQQDPLHVLIGLVGGVTCLEKLLHSDPPKVLYLLRAIYCHNNAVVRLLLDHNADPDCSDSREVAPLLQAVERGKPYITYHLLRKGACVHCRDGALRTPLHLAAQYARWWRGLRIDSDRYPELLAEQSRNLVNFLLSYNADPHLEDAARVSPLHEAMKVGNVAVIDLLVKGGANLRAIDVENSPWRHVLQPGARARAEDILMLFEPEDIPTILSAHLKFYMSGGQGDPNEVHMVIMNKIIGSSILINLSCGKKFSRENDRMFSETINRGLRNVTTAMCHKLGLDARRHTFDSNDYVRKCQAEMERMERAPLSSSYKYTVLDVLKRDSEWLGKLLMNDDLRKAVESTDFEKKYENYGGMLKHRIGQGMRKMEAFKRSFWTIKMIFNKVAHLPTEIVLEILNYLDEADITFLDITLRLQE